MRISIQDFAQLLGFAALMSVGQLLFKNAAGSLVGDPSLGQSFVKMLQAPTFWVACFLYAGATMLWVWLLSRIPLSIAYPFAALSLLIVPFLSWLLYSEPLTFKYWLGIAIILLGMFVVANSWAD